jgi:fumarylacetoacetase
VSALLPAHIGDYTDFYSSKEHATNIGLMIRDKTQPLLPNWHHLPVGYHGRASSILASPHPIQRPWGQIRPQEDLPPLLSPSKRLDFELEVAYFVGPGNLIGRPISVDDASDHIFGLVLLNDWSARDIQRWEYQPLGPFVSKSFATSISPWVIPMLALEPFRVPLPPCEVPLLPYLTPSPHKPLWGLDMALEVSLKVGDTATVLTRSNTKYLHWSMAQQLAHHTITGCNVRPGDLMASGTISGPTPDSYGSLMELSWNATKPLSCGAHTRTFLEDGDEVIMTGWCEGLEGRVGFGDLRGQILA